MLVVMTCTMAIGAPIMAVGGIIMAVHDDVGLSPLLVVSIPALVIVLAVIVSRMVPQFRLMQDRIDNVNRVLREQITGMRVVRAFVREPEESVRFEKVNDDLTVDVAHRRTAHGPDVPGGAAGRERVERGRHLVRLRPGRQRRRCRSATWWRSSATSPSS